MPSSSTYPSIPMPQDNVDSLYQACLTMRQTLQLLIVNSQQITDQTLTKASQIFSKKTDSAAVVDIVNNNLSTVNKAISNVSQVIGTLQINVSTLQGQMSAITARVSALESRMTNVENSIASLNSSVATLQSDVVTLQSDVVTLQSDIILINTEFSNYLLLSGGTMTGDLTVHTSAGKLFFTQTSDATIHTLNPVVSP